MKLSDSPRGPLPPCLPIPTRAVATLRMAVGGGALSRVSRGGPQQEDNSGWPTLTVTSETILEAEGSHSVTGRVGREHLVRLTGPAAERPSHLPAGRATESFSFIPPSQPSRRV